MELLKQIPKITIYQHPWVKKSLVDVLAKEMACVINESIWIEVHYHQVLKPINIELIEKNTIESEVSSINEG